MNTLFAQRTKIVATSGPACDDAATLERLIDAGVSVVRLNFSHLAPYRDVRSFPMPAHAQNRDQLLADAHALLLENGRIEHGDLLVLTVGESINIAGGTNTLKIVRTGEKLNA